MDVFAFALIVTYKPDPTTSFESGSVDVIDHQYFLNVLAVEEKPNYNLLDRTKSSFDGLFEIKNKDGKSIPQVVGLDNINIIAEYSVSYVGYSDDQLRKLNIFSGELINQAKELLERFDNSHIHPIRSTLSENCDDDDDFYFYLIPQGVIERDKFFGFPSYSYHSVGRSEDGFTSLVNHESTYRGSDFRIKFQRGNGCFSQMNTGVEDE